MGSLIVLDERKWITAFFPCAVTLTCKFAPEMVGFPFKAAFASSPVTTTVPENGSPKAELTCKPPKPDHTGVLPSKSKDIAMIF